MQLTGLPNKEVINHQIERIKKLSINNREVLRDLGTIIIPNFEKWLPFIDEMKLGISAREVKQLLATQFCLRVLIDTQGKPPDDPAVKEGLKLWIDWVNHWQVGDSKEQILRDAHTIMQAAAPTSNSTSFANSPRTAPTASSGPSEPSASSQLTRANPTAVVRRPVETQVIKTIGRNTLLKGEMVEQAYSSIGKIEFLPEDSSDRGLRHDRLRFKKPLTVTFAACKKVLQEVISHAGVDPETEILFRALANNQFDLHIPRPPEQWKILSYTDFLHAGWDKSKSTLGSYLSRRFFVPPHEPPRVPVGVNLDMEEVAIRFSTGVFITGKPNQGKSELVKSILMTLAIGFQPNYLWWVGADWKDGALLDKFSCLPSCVQPIAKSEKEAQELMKWLKAQFKRRERLLDPYKKYGVENICHYNKLPDVEPMPWLLLFWEELARGREVLGETQDEFLRSVCQYWRYIGIIPVATTQYPSQNISGSGPGMRSAYGTKVAFKNDEGAKLLFGESSIHAKYAQALNGPGDCIVVGDDSFDRCQTFFVEPEILLQIIDAISQRDADYSLPELALIGPEEEERAVASDPSSPASSESEPDREEVLAMSTSYQEETITETDESDLSDLPNNMLDMVRRFQDYNRLMQLDADLKKEGKPGVTQNHKLAMLVGDYLYPKGDPRRGVYQGWLSVDEFKNLDKSDPRLKVSKGGRYLDNAKLRLEEIIQKVSGVNQPVAC
jgi:hypothetical protein